MKGRIVEDDDISFGKLRNERHFDPFEKEVSVAISAEDHRSEQRILFQSCHQIDALARGSVSLFLRFATRSSRCPAIRIDFIAIHARLIDPDTFFLRNFLKRAQERFALFLVAFAVARLFFFRVQPRRFKVRLRHISLTSPSHRSFMRLSVEWA